MGIVSLKRIFLKKVVFCFYSHHRHSIMMLLFEVWIPYYVFY